MVRKRKRDPEHFDSLLIWMGRSGKISVEQVMLE